MVTSVGKLKKPSVGSAPPTPDEALGNVKPKASILVELARRHREETSAKAALKLFEEAAAGEESAVAAEKVKSTRKGRPPLDYTTRQLGARVSAQTYDRVQAITKRERVGLGPLVDRMVVLYEEARLAQAKALGTQAEGESADDFIARVFRL